MGGVPWIGRLQLVLRPGRALVHDGDRAHAFVSKLLYAFTFVGLGRINVALGIRD